VAGIGFELRRLMETRTISGFLGAAFSGTFIVAGPWIISAASVAAAQRLPFFAGEGVALAFTGAMVWAFALSLCASSGPLYAFVRLSADLVYDRRMGEASTLLLKTAAIAAAASLPLGAAAAALLAPGAANAPLRAAFALLLAAVDTLWVAMMTVTVLRKYGLILASYGAGMLVMYFLAARLGPVLGAAGGLFALAAGYGLTALLLVAITVVSLGAAPYPRALRGLLACGWKCRNLVLSGFAYAVGTWADKVVLWAFRGVASPGTGFAVFPPYDTAFYYANLGIIPGLVFFTLATETDFHLDLKRFLVFLAHRRQPDIEAARVRLARNSRIAIRDQSLFQGVVTVALALLAPALSAGLGFSAPTFVVLVAAAFFQLVLLTALNMLFYLELYRDAAVSALAFAFLNAGLSLGAASHPVLPLGLPFLLACASAAAIALAFLRRGLAAFDRIVYLRASGEEFGR